MKGYKEKPKSKQKKDINASTKDFKEELINQALNFHSKGNIVEAKKYYQYFINYGFTDHRVFSNYGILLKGLGKLEEAELLQRKAIELKPDFANAHANLGNILSSLGKLEEAELSQRKAIELKPDFADAYFNLGRILIDLGRFKEAELATIKAIDLRNDFANAHSNLGNILGSLGRFKEAELAIRRAIEINPDLANAHSNLGNILCRLGRFKEAELAIQRAIEINPNLATCYQTLTLLLYSKDNTSLALKSIEKAVSIDSFSKDNQLLLRVIRARNNKKNHAISNTIDIKNNEEKLLLTPIILNRSVDTKLIDSLYKIKSIDLNKFEDPTFGNAKGSDYKLFETNKKITDELRKDLTCIINKVLKSDIFIRDSFYTILSGESTIAKHNHIVSIDKIGDLNLWKQKYSLVYYLSVGDQNCKHPGYLQFYKDKNDISPNEQVLPSEGMIIIFPANKYHSIKYNGKKDRIIIGVNFYSL